MIAAPAFLPGTVSSSSARLPKLLVVVWLLLVFNTLGSQGGELLIPIPRSLVQVVTMGAGMLAFALALVLNPTARIRPSAYVFLLTLLLVGTIAGSVPLTAGWGSAFRCFRFSVFVATLWLITPWMTQALALLRTHVRVLIFVLIPVAAGLVISPGTAMPASNDGRLSGTLWPIPAPQVGMYGAIVAGLLVLMWINRHTDARSVGLVGVPAVLILVLSHTRTAMLGLVVGLVVAVLSLLLTSERARRTFMIAAGIVAVGFVPLGPVVQVWLLRGQDAEALNNLTGRTKVWDALLAAPRTWFQELFGTGLSNKSFNGLPIDSSWLAVYHEQGFLGLTMVVLFLLTLLLVAISRQPSPTRAYALFLITYVLVASYTEVGLGDASPYLIILFVAASLLTVVPQRTDDRERNAGRVSRDVQAQ